MIPIITSDDTLPGTPPPFDSLSDEWNYRGRDLIKLSKIWIKRHIIRRQVFKFETKHIKHRTYTRECGNCIHPTPLEQFLIKPTISTTTIEEYCVRRGKLIQTI